MARRARETEISSPEAVLAAERLKARRPRVAVTNETRVVLVHGGYVEASYLGSGYTVAGKVPLALLRDFTDAAIRHLPADATVVVGTTTVVASSTKDLRDA